MMCDNYLSILLNIPLLVLHGHNLRRHPRMALAGMVSTLATLGTLSLPLTTPWSPPPLVAAVLDLVYTLSLLEFVHTFHEIILNDERPVVIRIVRWISTDKVIDADATTILSVRIEKIMYCLKG